MVKPHAGAGLFMHNLDLILTLTAGLTVALACGLLALRLKLPPIVGYLIAGMIIGPHTPGFVGNRAIADQLAEIGVILLMFGVGLHFHLKDLLAVRGVAITGALVQIAVASVCGAFAARSFGWSWAAGAIFGVALSVASTVVLTRVLSDNHDLQSRTGRIAIGWLVVEDIFTVFVLVVMPAVFGEDSGKVSLPVALGLSGLKLTALTSLTLVAGGRYIPRLLTVVARTQSRELFTLTVLVIALGIAVGSAKLFGVSMALGAFLAGMVVGQSEFSYRAASEALPMRDAFAVLFFVSVGMLFDPAHLIREPVLTLITTLIVLVAKPIAAFAIVILLGYGVRIGLRVAIALAQIGEFSYIVASLGDHLRILPPGATDSIVAASIVSITLNPLLYKWIPSIEKALMRHQWLRRLLEPRAGREQVPEPVSEADAPEHRAIVVGYGPVGQTVCRLLKQYDIEPTIIELNIETVQRLNKEGKPAVYGDASHPDILKEAGVLSATALILSAHGSPEWTEIVKAARQLNPTIQVLVRSAFLSETGAMRQAGADEVFSGEAEVAMAMIDFMLRHLGSTPDQIEQEGIRARRDLYSVTEQ